MPGKRMGRPIKPAEEGKRYSLGLMVTGRMKNFVDETAKATGRTQSQVAEMLMEKGVNFDRMLDAMTMLAQRGARIADPSERTHRDD